MRCNSGVKLFGLRPEIVAILPMVESVYQDIVGQGVTIFSACDKTHRSIVHSIGCAIDIRTRYDDKSEQWGATIKQRLVLMLKDALTTEFDVVLEKDHIHIELDRR